MLRKGRLLLFGLAVAPYLLIASVRDQAKPTYAADVLPVMKAHCASCHSGPSASAGLDLTTIAGIKKVIRAKDSKNSVLIQRMKGIGGAQMPMGFAPLSNDIIDKIAGWIDAGAPVDAGAGKHWAYIKPLRPKMPQLSSHWVRNPIDAFVLARLQKEGLKPSVEAPKEVLLRRVYLDLIGLPPTPKEIDAFLSDKRPDAYERVVDSLMKNPHYGERQAEPWLDLSRYADSDGYEKDLNRTAWKYRDWLIDAFNRNLPYDQFTTEQLSGDLLPNPSLDQLIATGFNRNTMFNREGGVDQEDAHFNVVVDRVNTTATVWLGSTLRCAQCHDHKYDPFTQRDFYKMAAFYANSVILPEGSKVYGEEKWFESSIRAPSPQQAADERKLKGEVGELSRRMQLWSPELESAYVKWIADAAHGPAWTVMVPEKLSAKNGTTLAADQFGVVTAGGPVPDVEDYSLSGQTGLTRITGLSLEAIASSDLPSKGPGRAANGNFLINTIKLTVGSKELTFDKAVADFDQKEYGAANLVGNLQGWAVDGAEGKSHEVVLELKEPIDVLPGTPIRIDIAQHWPGGKHTLGKFQISLTPSENPVMLTIPPKIRGLIAMQGKDDAAGKALKDYFRKQTPLLESDRSKLVQLTKELNRLESKIPTALIMRDKPVAGPLTAYVHSRGEFLSPTDLVAAGYPTVLSPVQTVATTGTSNFTQIAHLKTSGETVPAPVTRINANGRGDIKGPVLTRLDLAKWLVSRENPLTARVEVNRLWEQFFGRGIVETSEDFGTQGARPSHPELLDWLACEFMDRHWDMKAMVRMIVTSAVYRQSSVATPTLMAKDPQNVLLARGPRVRLDSETIRDCVLSASGLLSGMIGGPSVFPSQPAGVWDTPYNGEQWMESKGQDRYRRGLYTFMKRSSPYPSFLSFDSTSRESCTVRRIRTNTPLQALAMLNDQAVFECARALGERMVKEGGATDMQKLAYGFRLCAARKPTMAELTRLDQLLVKMQARYGMNSAAAKKIAATPEQAAWTMVGNVLLNLDETVTKG